jgi:putative endonuclease
VHWYVYILRCGDGSLYTGITTDVKRRVEAHDEGRGAKYTRGRGPFEVVSSVGPFDRSTALRLEIRVKRAAPENKLAVLHAEPGR